MHPSRLRTLKSALKRYDPYLFVKTDSMGKIHVFHKGMFKESWALSLTSDWQPDSDPCDWGLVPILHRLSYIQADRLLDDYAKVQEKREEQERLKKRASHNEMMAMASEMRPIIREAFKDINTASMDKVDVRTKEDRKYANTKP